VLAATLASSGLTACAGSVAPKAADATTDTSIPALSSLPGPGLDRLAVVPLLLGATAGHEGHAGIQLTSVDHGSFGSSDRPSSPETLAAVRAVAVCEAPVVEPREPTCNFDRGRAGQGVKLFRARAQGTVRWCAGDEPMPWVSSARAAKIDVPFDALGLPELSSYRRPGTGVELGKVIDHHWAVVTVFGAPALVATNGSAVPLRHADGTPATEVVAGGTYPPTKGDLLRMPDGAGPMYRVAPDGTVEPVDAPHADARYLGWADGAGGQDSLWRWPTARGEVWAVVHHRADGSIAGEPELYPPPSLCEERGETSSARGAELERALRFRLDRAAPDNVRHGGHPSRGLRVAVDGDHLCLDHARGAEDRRFWRAAQTGGSTPGGERVTCARWSLDVEGPGSTHASAAEQSGRAAGGAMSVR
jgi:hypothetical protein